MAASPDNDKKIFENAALKGKVADKDCLDEALTTLAEVYRVTRVPRKDALATLNRLRADIESGKSHNQAKRLKRVSSLTSGLANLFNIKESDEE